MSAGRRAHDANALGIESARGCLAANHADSTLGVLPSRRMLGEGRSGARMAVIDGHNRHPLLVEIAPGWSHFKSIRHAVVICAARPDYLNRLRLQVLR